MFQSANLVYVVTETGFFSFSQLTVQGLKYLHSQGIAHRDLKPANVLVGNSHYSSLAMEDMGTVFQDRPIICKLTDFGESRSQYAQTHMSMLSSRTSRVDIQVIVVSNKGCWLNLFVSTVQNKRLIMIKRI